MIGVVSFLQKMMNPVYFKVILLYREQIKRYNSTDTSLCHSVAKQLTSKTHFCHINATPHLWAAKRGEGFLPLLFPLCD